MKLLKLNKKYSGLLVAFFMTLVLDTSMTFIMTMVNNGWNDAFIHKFLNGWIIGFIVAFPTSILIIPFARRLAAKLIA